MLQLKNVTPFAAEIATFPNEQGIDSLFVIVKGTFLIGPQLTLAEPQTPPQMGDEYWGEPEQSSIKILSDFHVGKLASDIIMQGNACAPNEQPVSQMDVTLSVGKVSKTVRVFGDRYWQNGIPSVATPFQEMPLVYERAFGGEYQIDEEIFAEERNPIGCGFVGKRSEQEIEGLPVPNIEDPQNLIINCKSNPLPAGFAPTSGHWFPRYEWAGSYDENWQTTRAPYLPEDFDKRFLNAAHSDLIYPGYLEGGEPILIKGMHPSEEISLSVPQVKIKCYVQLKGESIPIHLNIETLTLDPNKQQLSLVWLASFECNKNLLNISEVELKLAR
jgi:hypothetical protein